MQGLRAAAPVVARIRDASLRPEYARRLAGMAGHGRRRGAERRGAGGRSGGRGTSSAQRPPHPEAEGQGPATPAPEPVLERPDLRDPVLGAEGRLLQVLLQFPTQVPDSAFAQLSESSFTHQVFVAMFRAIQDAGAPSQATGDWMDKVTAAAPNAVQQLVRELAVAPLPVRGSDNIGRFAEDLVRGARHRQLLRRKAELYSRLQRADAAGDAAAREAVNAELMAVQREEHALRGT